MAPKLHVLFFICCYHLKIGGFHIVIKRPGNTGLRYLGGSAKLQLGRDCPP